MLREFPGAAYDAWKTTEPDYLWEGEEPEEDDWEDELACSEYGELEPVDEGWWDSVLSAERLSL